MQPGRRGAAVAAAALAAALAAAASHPASTIRFSIRSLVADPGYPAAVHDAELVNAWGLAASPTGPWWTSNEARSSSTVYAADGRKQALTVSVPGGPTGIVYNGGRGFVVRGGGGAAPARFLYACEDGMIRGWSPTVPRGWSKEAVVAVDDSGEGAVFRGLALATLPDGAKRLYATDFHNGRVLVFDGGWRRIARRGAFQDASIPAWYAPFGIVAAGSHVFVSYAYRAPVNGNDAPKGGYVDEFDLSGRLVARVASGAPLAEPWGLAVAPKGFGPLGGALLVASFGTGQITAYTRTAEGWKLGDVLRDGSGRPLTVPGVWGIAFGRGGMSGPRTTLFAAAGPHAWHGASEVAIHGLLAAIEPL